MDLLRRRSEEEVRSREEARSRSATPGPSLGRVLLDRHRKTPIPILCSRGAWMVYQTSNTLVLFLATGNRLPKSIDVL